MGDFNVKSSNYTSHNSTNDFLSTIISHNLLLPYIFHPTRATNNSEAVIYNIFPRNTTYKTFF